VSNKKTGKDWFIYRYPVRTGS